MEILKQLAKDCVTYCKEHFILTAILGGSLAIVLITIIALIAKAARNKKARKRLAQTVKEPVAVVKEPVQEQVAIQNEEPIQEEVVTQKEEPVQEEVAVTKEEPVEKKESGIIEQVNASPNKIDFYEESETDKQAKYKGKWTICRVVPEENAEEETYFFELHASNGEKLLSSEEYTSYAGALRGIQTHKNNIAKGNFKVVLSKKGDYIFKLLSGKNMLLCMGENYPTKARCESAIESTKRFAETAVLDENVQDHVVKIPIEDDVVEPLPDGYNGKWIVSDMKNNDGEQVYYFELFANNGEKLLSSEEYTTYIGAINGIETHKNNIAKGNFRISLTKRGDYIYKILNGNGQLLCLGEHYKTKRRCLNAVESVKRFAMNSPMLVSPYLTK